MVDHVGDAIWLLVCVLSAGILEGLDAAMNADFAPTRPMEVPALGVEETG